MDVLVRLADRAIRRLCAPPGLGMVLVMLAFAATPPVALRFAGHVAGVTGLALLIAAWRAPRRDLRHSTLWARLGAEAESLARLVAGGVVQAQLAKTLQARLLWHAERIGALAMALWAASLLAGVPPFARS
ncbi:hypothetical protein [Plastoroseomonas arctica]|uniref:Uncharacterized protein n=1 Tax=Plastoroseomonas arctica TaxID=1509237 RepID=A0AAF1KN80_9PROT|nr:hypothetical protein [Plastoroseomonas arctica]MBR0656264.1 hypothetical protein [Plastoroseomonas arctica]